MKKSKDINLAPHPLIPFKFMTYEDYLFERILYIREVLANTHRYIDAPDENTLNAELFRLIVDYEDAIGKKIDENGVGLI